MTVDWLVESYPKVAEGTACAEVQRQRMWPAWWQARRPPCQRQEFTVVMTAGTAQRWSPGPCWACSSLLTQLASSRSWRGALPRSLATVTFRTCSQGNIQHTWADSSFSQWDRETTQEQGWDSVPLHTSPYSLLSRWTDYFQGQTATACNLLKKYQESTRTLWPGKTMTQVRFHGQL